MSELSDDPSFDHLEAYLQRLQRGERIGNGDTDGDRLAQQHPQLKSAFDCLRALDSFAAPPDDDYRNTPTLNWLGGHARAEPMQRYGPFGEFDLLNEIGRGGMGVVFRARQRELDRFVALKMIPSHIATTDQISRLHQEAKAAAALRHPHIVDIYQVGEHFGQHYIAMQYVAGPNLANRLERGPLDPEVAAQLLTAIARAVQHLHDHGIVHRDLKPSNILLDDKDNPYVTDFGLAKVGDGDFVGSGAVAGTPSYMSPEQAAAGRQGPISSASDVYSLGTILFEMLTGGPPFVGENAAQTIMMVLENEPPLPRSLNARVPPDLQTICLKCLEKSPQKRYPSAAAVADELERFLKHEAIEVKPLNWWQRVVRWTRREPALAIRLLVIPVMYGLRRVIEGGFDPLTASVVAAWLLVSFICQRCIHRPQWAMTARFIWAAADSIFFTLLLLLLEGIRSPLVAAMPLLILGAGLWFHRRLVWFVMFLTMANYLLLWLASWQGWVGHPMPAAPGWDTLQRHLVFLLALGVTGILVAYHVARVRYLTHYFEAARRK